MASVRPYPNAMFDASNESDGSVGAIGKLLGTLGLDVDGARAATSWSDALKNTIDPRPYYGVGNILPLDSRPESHGFAVPGMISAPLEGFNAMWERGDDANIHNPEALDQSSRESFDAAGLAATGGLAAGMAGAVPEGAVAANGIGGKLKGWFGREPQTIQDTPQSYSDLVRTLPHGEQVQGTTGQPYSARVYRGSAEADSGSSGYDVNGVYASSSPAEASGFAPVSGDAANVRPLDVSFQNPLVIGAGGSDWSLVPFNGREMGTPELAKLARRRGHDGLVVNDVNEQISPNTTTVALKPGTVRSATTGDLLYANSPTGASVPLALNAMERGAPETVRAYKGGATSKNHYQNYPFGDADAAIPLSTDPIDSFQSTMGPWGGFFSNEPDVAGRFAGSNGKGIYPVDISLQNPRVIDAQGKHAAEFQFAPDGRMPEGSDPRFRGAPWSQEFQQWITDDAHDGLVLKNTADEGDVYIPTKRGTVRSATTGDLLYSNGGTGASVPLAFTDYDEQPRNAMMRQY